jgi:hypothetical protein
LKKYFEEYQNEIKNKKQQKELVRLLHCEFCNKGYNLTRNLHTHVKKDHSELYQKDVLKKKSLNIFCHYQLHE